MEPRNHKENVGLCFTSFCISVLKRTARYYYSEITRRGEHEVVFSGLAERDLAKLATTDAYFTDEYVFELSGERIAISDYGLGEALNALTPDRRNIVLMKFYLDMTDKEIAEKLNKKRRTVTDHRAKALLELKQFMESED